MSGPWESHRPCSPPIREEASLSDLLLCRRLSCAASSLEEALLVSCSSATGTLAGSPFPSILWAEAGAELPAAPGRKEAVLEKSQTWGERQSLNQTLLYCQQSQPPGQPSWPPAAPGPGALSLLRGGPQRPAMLCPVQQDLISVTCA